MKFVTFLKIFAICFCSLIGAFAVGYGVMYITGSFNEPEILPDAIYFEQVEYNVDNDFVVRVLTDKADVTIKDLELSLITDGEVAEKDGRISDGVISIPKTAQIGEEISITLEKTENEIDGLAWITGGHSTIRARSVNAKKNEANTNCDSAQTKINVDVPVHSVEVLTKVSDADSDSDKFAVNSKFKASLKFIPERSAYQFSYDGTKGYDKKLKTSYFILQSNNDTYISQEGTSNIFNALDVGTNSTIIGYCFKTTIIEKNFLDLHQGKDEAALRSAILEELKNGSNKAEEEKTAQTNSKTVEIVAVTVDSILANNELNLASVNKIHTIYANKNITDTENMSNLAIKLYSQVDESVSLQSQLGNVGIRFVVKDGENYIDAVSTEGYNVVSLEEGFYSQKVEVDVDGGTKTYYLPNITDSVDNYNWKFAINQESEHQLYVEVAYFNQGTMVCGSVYKSLGVKKVVSETITWNLTAAQRNVELKIDDNKDASLIKYEEYDLKNVIQIPSKNLYKTARFFAYTTSVLQGGKTLEDLIYVESSKTYMLNGQEYNLYELKDGVVKAKTVDAHGITFNVLFVTVKTNYKAEIEYSDPVEKIYKVDQYSKDIASLDNSVLPIRFTITKTLKELVSHLEYNGIEEDFIYNETDNSFAFVQGSVNPFDVVVSYGTAYNEEEDAIFKAAVESGDISIVVKTSEGLVTDFIKTSTIISDVKDERAFTRFTMNVGSLPVGNTFVNLNLYIRYIKTSTGEYVDVPVLLEFPDLNEYIHEKLNPAAGGEPDPGVGGEPDPESAVTPVYVADFIEVYDGAAEIFKFNLNNKLEEEGKAPTSQSNRIYVSSEITTAGEGDTVRATYISTQYLIEGEAIESGLFVEVLGNPTTDVAIILKDKYGKTPISSRYQLESSDTTRMVVSGDAFTFTTTTGTVELKLVNLATNNVEDVLHFDSQSAGEIKKVDVLKEEYTNKFVTKKMTTAHETVKDGAYAFNAINVTVYGYKDSVINLSIDDPIAAPSGGGKVFEVNLLNLYYEYIVPSVGKQSCSLLGLIKYELVNPSDKEDLKDMVSGLDGIEDAVSLKILKDFGSRKTIQLRAYVTELGISQPINLIIEPNIKIAISQPSSQGAKSWAGVPFYTGVFAETKYTLNVSFEYAVIGSYSEVGIEPDRSAYCLYAYDGNREVEVGTTSDFVKSSTAVLFQKDGFDQLQQYQIEIEFKSQQVEGGYQKISLEFKKQTAIRTGFDTSHIVYVYVNPNVKVSTTNETLYMTSVNGEIPVGQTYTVYGKYSIFGNKPATTYPITFERIEGALPIDLNKISFVAEDADNYKIALNAGEFELRCLNPLTKLEKVTLNVLYDPSAGFIGYNVGTITITISPDIRINPDSNRWVVYGENDEHYLKMVKGETCTFGDLLNSSFVIDGSVVDNVATVTDTTFNFLPNSDGFITGLYILDRDLLPITTNLTVGDITNIYTHNDIKAEEKDKLQIVVRLENGSQLTFNVILLPVDIPFVTYPNLGADDYKTVNISDLLLITEDVEWLKEKGYYYTIEETIPLDDEDAIDIAYTKEDLETEYGIQLIDGAIYTVDKGQYASYKDGKLGTSPVGADTFVVLTANLGSEGIVNVSGLKIPYLIKIQKELTMGVYYPYDSTAINATQTVSDADLKDYEADFIREYISFESNGQATIDLLETQTNIVPNKSQETGKRIAILKGANEYLDDKAREKIRFEVTKVYCDAITGFMKINDVNRYAKFSAAQNSGKLTIYSNGSQKIRLEIKITAGEGLIAYYYISVGEVPANMQLRYYKGDPCDINITANREYDDILNQYTLLQIIPDDNITNNLTNLLHFHTPDSRLTINEVSKTLKTEPTTNNWYTELIIYTKYGYLCDVDVNVESNYKVTANVSQFASGSIIDISNFDAKKDGSTVTAVIDSIELERDAQDLFDYDKYLYIDGDKIVIGAVTSPVQATYKMEFNLGDIAGTGEDVIYIFFFELKAIPVLEVAEYNEEIISKNNRFEVTPEENSAKLNLNNLFVYDEAAAGGVDFSIWRASVETNNIGEFEGEIVSEVQLKSEYKIDSIENDGTIIVSFPDVVEVTVILFKVEYRNVFGGNKYTIFTSYFGFTLNPVVELTLNYPQANHNQQASFTSEYFYVGEKGNEEEFYLNATNAISKDERVVIPDEGRKVYLYTSFSTLTGTTEVFVDGLTANVGEKYEYSKKFTFNMTNAEDVVTFTIFYKIEDGSGVNHYFAIGTYILNIYKNISNVWNANTINFNTDSIQNSSVNNEILYIGSKDDIIKRVKVEVLIDFEDGFTYDNELNLKVDHIFGIGATSNLIRVYDGRTTTVDVYLNEPNVSSPSPDDMINNFYQLEYKFFNAEGTEISDDDVINNIKVVIKNVKTRISIYYGSQECDIYKMFSILNSGEFSNGEITEYPIKASLGHTYVIGAYYAERIIDAKFDTQEVELSTGQSVSLLAKNPTITSINHSFLLNMRHISDNTPYELKDIVENSIAFSIGDVSGNNMGYLRVTPLTSKYDDKKEYVYDYIFLAMGAPNDSVTVVVDFIITVDGSTSATIPITFIISNDYKGLVKKNTDGTDNSQLNRNKILATSTTMSDNVYTFATAGAAKVEYDFLFIEHSNIIEGAVTGNIIPYFAITVDNDGQSYILKREQTDYNMDLVFSFRRCEFGNVNIDLTFRDDFGYEFEYFITLVASYNPVYLTTSVIVYEQDSLIVTNEADSDTSENLLRVKFEKAEETFANIDATSESVSIDEIKFAFEIVRGAGASQTTTNRVISSSDVDPLIIINDRASGKYRFTISILPDDCYSDNETSIKGKLSIIFEYAGIKKEISLEITVKQLYTLKTVDDTVYVRDGVDFSLIDIVEVINNKNSVKVGEKQLTREDTAYIKYSLVKDNKGDSYTLDDCEDVDISLGIQAYNRNSGKYTTMALAEVGGKTVSYTSLQDLFGSEVSVSSCDFRLVYWDPQGNINHIKKTVGAGGGSINEPYTIRAGDDNGESVSVKFSAYYPKDKDENFIDNPIYAVDDGSSAITIGENTYYKHTDASKNHFYTLIIQSGYIIKDQILSIGLRKIENYTSSNINVYFKNGTNGYKTLVVNCDADEVRKISLCEYGIITSGRYTEFYTDIIGSVGKEIVVVDGMSEDDRAKLKDISFAAVKINEMDVSLKNKYALSTNLTELDKDDYGEDVYDVVNGTKIYYQTQTLSLQVDYGRVYSSTDGEVEYLKRAALTSEQGQMKVTLRYIAVNKSIAYGSSQIRYATKVVNNNEIEIESWAGTTGTRPFILVPGYSTATLYPTNEKLNVGDNAGDGSVLRFKINSTESGAGDGLKDFATINDKGKITLGKDFDRANNYIAIDIGVGYGSSEEKYIDTVKIAVYNPKADSVQQNYKNLVVKKEGTEYTASVKDIYNLITIIDTNGNEWTGEDLLMFAGDDNLMIYLNGDAANNELFTLSGDFSFKLDGTEPTPDNFVVNYKVGDEEGCIEIPLSDFVENRFMANSLNNNGIIKFNFANEIVSFGQLLQGIVENIEFIDVYGKAYIGKDLSFKEKNGSNTTGYLYEVYDENGTKVEIKEELGNISKNKTYTIKFLEVKGSEIALGSVEFIIRKAAIYKEVIEVSKEAFKSSDDDKDKGFDVFGGSDAFKYTGYTVNASGDYVITLPNTFGATVAGDVIIGEKTLGYVLAESNIIITVEAESWDFINDKIYEVMVGENIVGMFICKKDYTAAASNKNIFDKIAEYNKIDKADLQVRISDGENNVQTLYSDDHNKWILQIKSILESDTISIQIYQTLPQTTNGDAKELIYYELTIKITE